MTKDKCARKFDHRWDNDNPVKVTRSHRVVRCKRCKGIMFKARRN